MDVVQAINVYFLLSTACEVDQSSFAGAVTGAVWDIDCASSTGDVEDAATTLLPEDWQKESHKGIGSMEVDLELLEKLLGIL